MQKADCRAQIVKGTKILLQFAICMLNSAIKKAASTLRVAAKPQKNQMKTIFLTLLPWGPMQFFVAGLGVATISL